MIKVFEINDLNELEQALKNQNDIDQLREDLFRQFIIYSDYKNAEEWNKAVRICECLAIIGWGVNEPLEALRGMYFNGNPTTYFINKFGEPRFVDAIWSKRKNGLTMEQGRTSYHYSSDDKSQNPTILWEYKTKEDIQDLKLESQRNWIPKNPIWIERTINNCYENSRAFIESIENDLQSELNLRMCPEKYGRSINQIIFNCAYSFYDNTNCKTNYIIAQDDKKMSNEQAWLELHNILSEKEIKENGYYLRKRIEYGSFRSNTGKIRIQIHFEKEFSELNHKEQKKKFSEYILLALSNLVDKLKKKQLNYNFDLLTNDFNTILTEWNGKD